MAEKKSANVKNAKLRVSTKLILLVPVFILGIVCMMSSIISVINIQGINAKASVIANEYMTGITELGKIQKETQNVHKMGLSHVLAIDLNSMLALVDAIKEEEKVLDGYLADFRPRSEERRVVKKCKSRVWGGG